ncbi:MAG: AAA family ATPase [Clostridia bacterium]|nr:AAA family ATPase [Clostridia bacterium]
MNNEREVLERTVLGCLAGYSDALKEYVPQLSEDDFSICPGAFKLMRECYDGGNFSMATILAKFAGQGKMSFIRDCIAEAPTVLEFQPALKRLREVSAAEHLEQGVTDLLTQRNLSPQSLRQLLEDAQSRAVGQSDEETCMKNVDKYLEELGKPRDIVKTGFPIVDKTLSGLRKKTVCYIGARPSTGKTSFAINIAQAQKEKRVLFFSLEMTAAMIYERYTSALVKLPYERFTENSFSEDEMKVIRAVLEGIKHDKRLFVIDDMFSIEAIESAVMNLRPDMVVIDYIQLVTSSTRRFNFDRDRVNYVSKELKKLAKIANCAVIGLAQVKREGADAPRMSDLKECGALEEDGDYVLMMHRPYVKDKDESIDPAETHILIDKNKFGKNGLVRMHFDVQFQRFSEKGDRSVNEKL